jgi:hypothetical protein
VTNDATPRYEPIDRQQVVLEPLDVEQLIPEAMPRGMFGRF